MSYRVYEAWKLFGMPNTTQLLNWCREIARPEMVKVMHRELKEFVSKHPDSVTSDDHRKIYIEHFWSCTGVRKEVVDPSLEAVFIPCDSDVLVLLLHRGPYSYREQMDTLAKPWGFWDSSDRDETIPMSEWKRRRRDWRRALKDNGVPAEVGFSYQLVPKTMPLPNDLYPDEEVIKHGE